MSETIEKEKAKKTKIIVKAPTQERSRQTVATILEACSRLLVSEGFYSITTDKIAKEAGVSIGSLYQFFGNKESVVQAVVKNVLDEDKRIISERMRTISPLPTEQRVTAVFELAVEVVRRNSELRSKLSTIQYYVAEASYVSEMIQFFQEIIRYNLPQMPGRDADKVSYVIVNAFIGMVNTMSLDRPDYINDAAIVKEMAQMFYRYVDMNPVTTPVVGAQASRPKGDFI